MSMLTMLVIVIVVVVVVVVYVCVTECMCVYVLCVRGLHFKCYFWPICLLNLFL